MTNAYEVTRIPTDEITDVDSSDDYQYDIQNDGTANGFQFVLYPPAQITNSTYLTRWYLRNAERLTSGASKIDIPEYSDFIKRYVKVRIGEKEMNPNLRDWRNELKQLAEEMILSLENLTEDPHENDIKPDVSFYRDFVGRS